MKRIAVLTSGRDVSGSNAAIRAIVRKAIGSGCSVYGAHNGFRGLFEDHIERLTSRDVSGRIGKASSFLGNSHNFDFDNSKIQTCLANLNKRSIDGLVVVGGSGSFALGQKLAKAGLPVVGVPATIQDDVVGTDICLGVDSAVNNIMDCVDHIRSCDSSRNRSFLIQVEGRESGSLAIRSALVTGAEICLIPEESNRSLEEIAKKMEKALDAGKTQCIAIMSAGWKPGIDVLSKHLEEHAKETDLHVRKTILGYIQRGGSPSGFDRLLGTEMGAEAVQCLLDGMSSHFVGKQGSLLVRVPFEETIGKWKHATKEQIEMFRNTF
jgi:6-phosphofructokinase 1